MEGQRVLVTGAGGYIGSVLTTALIRLGCEVVAWRRKSVTPAIRNRGGHEADCSSVVRWIHGALDEPRIWEQQLDGVQVVFHLAAQTSARRANADPFLDHRSNVLPALVMLQACRSMANKPFAVLVGAATQAGLTTTIPLPPDHRDSPITFYDLHKLFAEQYLQTYVHLGYARGVMLRLTNVYGPGRTSSNSDRGVLNQMVGKALRGEPITVYGDGKQVRDYVFIQDVVEALLAAAKHSAATNGRVMVVGSGRGHTLRQAFELVAACAHELTGVHVPVISVPSPGDLSPIEDRSFVADPSLMAACTGWYPKTSLRCGIIHTIAEMQSRPT